MSDSITNVSIVGNAQIKKIYEEYFEIIDSYFGGISHHLGKEEDSHIDLGYDLSEYPLIADLMVDSIYDLKDAIFSFWETNSDIVFDYIRKIDKLKCVYSGNFTPAILEKFIKKCSLYIDTLIIPDPIFNVVDLRDEVIKDKHYYLRILTLNVFNVWRLKDIILEGIEVDIIYILPINMRRLKQTQINSLLIDAEKKVVNYYNDIFKEKIDNDVDIVKRIKQLKNPEDVFDSMSNPDRLPDGFNTKEHIKSFLDDLKGMGENTVVKYESAGMDFYRFIKSQFVRVQEHKYFCDLLSAEPAEI
jgi:hypothetical protein